MYKQILVPLDGSELAEAALPHARELAKAFHATISLMTVIEPIFLSPEPGVIGPVVNVALNIEDETRSASQYLEKIAEQLRAEVPEVHIVIRQGHAASHICDYAEEIKADVIVMSTHGRSGIQRWVYGSVADRVLRGAKVPVLLIRAQTGS